MWRCTFSLLLLLGITSVGKPSLQADPSKPATALTASEAKSSLQKWLTQAAKIKSLSADLEQMRELPVLKSKLSRKGKVWFADHGLLRWQMGEPPNLVVTREKSGDLLVLEPKKAKAQRWSKEALLAQEKQGQGNGFAMMDAMRTPSVKEFEEQFQIVSAAPGEEAGRVVFDLVMKDPQAANFIRSIELEVNPSAGTLHRMSMVMKDKARLHTLVKEQILNPKIAESTFHLDTTGYKVEEHR